MTGWSYLDITIKSKEFVSKLKENKLWAKIGSDSDVEITDDTFRYCNDETAPLFCTAPSSIQDFADALKYFLIERYDDLASALEICNDHKLLETVQAIDWEYSGPDDEYERPGFHWVAPKKSTNATKTKRANPSSRFIPKQWVTLKIGTKSGKHYECDIEHLFLKEMRETSFKVSKTGNLYYNKTHIKSVFMLKVAIVHLLYTRSSGADQYLFEAVSAYLTNDDRNASVKTVAKAFSKVPAYQSMNNQALEIVARCSIEDIADNEELTEKLIPKVAEVLKGVDSLSDIKTIKIIDYVLTGPDEQPMSSEYCNVSF